MDAIKKKMQSLKSETDNALARAMQLDSEAREANQRAEKTEEHVRWHYLQVMQILIFLNIAWQVRDLQKKMQHLENDLDITIEKLTSTTTKLDEKEKAYAVAESEIQALNRKLVLEQDELERSESKLASVTSELNAASNRADEINRAIKILESKNMIDEERKVFFYKSSGLVPKTKKIFF